MPAIAPVEGSGTGPSSDLPWSGSSSKKRAQKKRIEIPERTALPKQAVVDLAVPVEGEEPEMGDNGLQDEHTMDFGIQMKMLEGLAVEDGGIDQLEATCPGEEDDATEEDAIAEHEAEVSIGSANMTVRS